MKKFYIYFISSLISLTTFSLQAQEETQTQEEAQAQEELKQEKRKSIFFVGVEDLAEKADKGDIEALSTLANYFLNGIIVEQNPEMAIDCYKKAADLGDIEAAYNVAVLYQSGASKDKNAPTLAFKYFKMAANDNINAMFNLGACYINGIGTKQDLIKAYYCFSKAAESVEQAKDVLAQIESFLDKNALKAAKEYLTKTEKI